MCWLDRYFWFTEEASNVFRKSTLYLKVWIYDFICGPLWFFIICFTEKSVKWFSKQLSFTLKFLFLLWFSGRIICCYTHSFHCHNRFLIFSYLAIHIGFVVTCLAVTCLAVTCLAVTCLAVTCLAVTWIAVTHLAVTWLAFTHLAVFLIILQFCLTIWLAVLLYFYLLGETTWAEIQLASRCRPL